MARLGPGAGKLVSGLGWTWASQGQVGLEGCRLAQLTAIPQWAFDASDGQKLKAVTLEGEKSTTETQTQLT